MEKQNKCSVGPFGVLINAPKQTEFDKYYIEVTEKEVFKKTGQVDENGDELGISEKKLICKKIDIAELINSQADSVGVDAYCRALMVQGVDINELNTVVDTDKVVDYSEMPDTLADVMTSGDRAKAIFENLDPALKGNHTTLEGFLNSLTQDNVDAYIKGRIEALTPKQEVVKEGE